MAEVPRNHIPCGYDEDFVDAHDEDVHCIICQLLSKEPVLTRCGHRFCKECLEECLRRQEQGGCPLTCPTDREALERDKDIFPDKLTERKILSFLIKCPSDNCEWTGELRAKEDHLASCPFKAVSCFNENCEVKVARKDLTEHVTTTCQWRIVKCDYCEELHPQCQMENHLETCEGLLFACPNHCGAEIASEKIANHVENKCPLTEVPCPYFWIGCCSKIRRQELESHLQCETRHHLDLACCKLNETQEEVRSLEGKVTIIQREHQEKVSNLQNQLEEKVDDLENQLEQRVNVLENRLEERVDIQTEINESVNNNHKKVERKLNTDRRALFVCFAVISVVAAALIGISNSVSVVEEQVSGVQSRLQVQRREEESTIKLEEKFKENTIKLEEKFKESTIKLEEKFKENTIKLEEKFKESTIKLEEKVSVLENTMQCFDEHNYKWKISGFSEVLRKAKSEEKNDIYSPPFYIYGYKCKLNLCPNGYSSGKNTHLSLFLIIMKGEYDATLPWPFHKKVTYTLIDQQENTNDRENIVMSFAADPKEEESFARPVTDQNTGRGFAEFVSHNKQRERRYTVDDTIFIQVQLSPPPWY